MIPPTTPPNEQQRLEALKRIKILDTESDESFDNITRHATLIYSAPISTVSLIDSNREWYKSCQGISVRENDRSISFCGHTILSSETLVIEDTYLDERFKDNPMVVGEPNIRFYAGTPIFSHSNLPIGAICIKDTKPRTFSDQEFSTLLALARWTEAEIDLFCYSHQVT